jgi:hypothetical protein
MRLRRRLAWFALTSGAVLLGTGACVSRWAGDFVADAIVIRLMG